MFITVFEFVSRAMFRLRTQVIIRRAVANFITGLFLLKYRIAKETIIYRSYSKMSKKIPAASHI